MEGATESDDHCPSDEELAAQLSELQRTWPDVSFDKLNLEQLADLQLAAARLLNCGECKRNESATAEG
jgi:hypothetical protein